MAATNDGVVRLCSIPSDSNRVASDELRGHHGSVFSVDVSSENQNVASGSIDGTIRLWAKDAPLSAKLLSDETSMPRVRASFTVEGAQISVKGHGDNKYSGKLPERFGEVSAAAVSANGAGIVVTPRFGQPLLLLDLRDDRITVSVPLNVIKSEWTDIAFIEGDTVIAAKTRDGRVFGWHFYSDGSR